MINRWFIAFLLVAVAGVLPLGGEALDLFSTATAQSVPADIEAQAKALEREIIAPCCWAKTVADEYSGVAYELRDRFRALLREGKSPDEIKEILVAQYGERILARPRGQGFTLLAWVVPPVFLLLVIFLVYRRLHRRGRGAPKPTVEAADTGQVTAVQESATPTQTGAGEAVTPKQADTAAARQKVERELADLEDIA